uniref:Peptidase M56 domain-containing protein n=1 Tax=uncultured bacterium contig00081 TaxID=1181557 RepID=A0A806K137_9BACT|nr:hypothetical protein [uncultured bacterium contig00081]
MTAMFITVLNMSIAASFAAAAVMLVRLPLKKAPKVFSYMLWGVVLFRLACPFGIESPFGLVPASAYAIPQDIAYSQAPVARTGIGFVDAALGLVYQPAALNGSPANRNNAANMDSGVSANSGNAAYSDSGASARDNVHADSASTGNSAPPENAAAAGSAAPSGNAASAVGNAPQATGATPVRTLIETSAHIWLLGFAALLIYAAASYLRLKRRVYYATLVRDNIYETDAIKTPFLLGFAQPRIYLPVGTNQAQQDFIIKHEQTHIRRRDYIIKPLAFAALAAHWFNPLMWAAYALMHKDMEMSCDEAVLGKADGDIRGAYSSSLLDLSVKRGGLLTPLAFGESDVKSRVKNALGFKKPSMAIIAAAVALVAILSVGFAVNRAGGFEPFAAGTYIAEDGLTQIVFHGNYEFYAIGPGSSYLQAGSWVYETGAGNRITLMCANEERCIFSYKNNRLTFEKAEAMTGGWAEDWISPGTVFTLGPDADTPPMPPPNAADPNGLSAPGLTNAPDVTNPANAPDATNTTDPLGAPDATYTPNERGAEILSKIYLGMPEAEVYEMFGVSDFLGSGVYVSGYDDIGAFYFDYDYNSPPQAQAAESAIPDSGGNSPEAPQPQTIAARINLISSLWDVPESRQADMPGRRGWSIPWPEYPPMTGKTWDIRELVSAAIKQRSAEFIYNYPGQYQAEAHANLWLDANADGFTIYVVSLYETFLPDGDYAVKSVGGACMPLALTFTKNADFDYELTEYWMPEDGDNYMPSIRARFPQGIWDFASTQLYAEQLTAICHNEAMYLLVGATPHEARFYISSDKTAIVTDCAISDVVDDIFVVWYFPGAALQIEEHAEEYETDNPSTWIIEYADPAKNTAIGIGGTDAIPITDDLIGIYNIHEQRYAMKFERHTPPEKTP